MTDFFQRDDGSLQQGLATLATKYFDATSEHNKHSETLLKHIDFQQFNNKPWDTVVQSILKGEVVGDILESGSEALKTAIKSGATILTESAEAAGGGLIVGALTDLVVDAATDMFKQKPEIFETYERGSWVYINRGHDHNKEKQRNELEAESLMFGDYDTEMQAFESKMMYSPGFYISGLPQSGKHIVYAFDVEQSITVIDNQLRPVRDKETLVKFDQDFGMTTIRELFLLKEAREAQQYYPYQKGDEVWHENKMYVVALNDKNGVLLLDPKTNKHLRVDEQSVTPGPRSHWHSQKPGDFRTVVGTFSRGTYAYRKLQKDDNPPNPDRAKGVLCVVSYFDGNKVQVIDCWSADMKLTNPNDIIQPTISCRSHMNNHPGFQQLKHAVVNQKPLAGLGLNTSDYEWLCWGYEQEIPFPDVKVYSDQIPIEKTEAPKIGAMEIVTDTVGNPKEVPVAQYQSPATWGIVASILAFLLFL